MHLLLLHQTPCTARSGAGCGRAPGRAICSSTRAVVHRLQRLQSTAPVSVHLPSCCVPWTAGLSTGTSPRRPRRWHATSRAASVFICSLSPPLSQVRALAFAASNTRGQRAEGREGGRYRLLGSHAPPGQSRSSSLLTQLGDHALEPRVRHSRSAAVRGPVPPAVAGQRRAGRGRRRVLQVRTPVRKHLVSCPPVQRNCATPRLPHRPHLGRWRCRGRARAAFLRARRLVSCACRCCPRPRQRAGDAPGQHLLARHTGTRGGLPWSAPFLRGPPARHTAGRRRRRAFRLAPRRTARAPRRVLRAPLLVHGRLRQSIRQAQRQRRQALRTGKNALACQIGKDVRLLPLPPTRPSPATSPPRRRPRPA